MLCVYTVHVLTIALAVKFGTGRDKNQPKDNLIKNSIGLVCIRLKLLLHIILLQLVRIEPFILSVNTYLYKTRCVLTSRFDYSLIHIYCIVDLIKFSLKTTYIISLMKLSVLEYEYILAIISELQQ